MTGESISSQSQNRLRQTRKLSSAASNVEQAKAKNDQGEKIESIVQTRAEHGVDLKTGDPTLTAVFSGKGRREPHHVDLNCLLV